MTDSCPNPNAAQRCPHPESQHGYHRAPRGQTNVTCAGDDGNCDCSFNISRARTALRSISQSIAIRRRWPSGPT